MDIGPGGSSGGMTDDQKEELEDLTGKKHEHDNKTTLDSITAALKTCLSNLASGIVDSALAVSGKISCSSTTSSTFAGGLDIEGYTNLGELSPGVKVAKISGTTPALGVTSSYSTGIDADKACGVSVLVSDSNAIWRMHSHGIQGTATEYFSAYIGTNGYLYIEIPSTSTDVYECAFVATIFYTP